MAIKVNNITLDIEEDISNLKNKTAKKLRISEDRIKKFTILKESIDARKKDIIKFNYSVEVVVENEAELVKKLNNKDVSIEEEFKEELIMGTETLKHRPVVIGMGPAGMFAALRLARNGYKPLVIERGENVEKRTETVQKFWDDGVLNSESNVQFGEGGAGTFSDGKLTTRIKDKRCKYIVDEFVGFGAPKEIAYLGKPHIGTDVLKGVVKNLREDIISLGGEVRFDSRLEDLVIKDKTLEAIVVNGEEIPCEVLILAIGHSSRDTYEMLYKNNIFMEAKPFAIGVRVEHLQSTINENQYGSLANHQGLRAADYRLTNKSKKTGRNVYSFCMCPGGEVVAASSEQGRLVTNGMSNFKRNGENANSALVVTVGPEDFKNESDKFDSNHDKDYPLLGMEFQRFYEELAFKVGGENFNAPVQLIGDFLKDQVSSKIGNVKPSYKPGYKFANLSTCLPSYVVDSLKDGIENFDRKIKGFSNYDNILTGIETRTSAPVKISRNDDLQSISVNGIYPSGEGSGFAGGIVSSAVDGLKCSESIIKKYKISD